MTHNKGVQGEGSGSEGGVGKKKLCAECGAHMVLRTGKYGRFYGCSSYPQCDNTEEVDESKKDEQKGGE